MLCFWSEEQAQPSLIICAQGMLHWQLPVASAPPVTNSVLGGEISLHLVILLQLVTLLLHVLISKEWEKNKSGRESRVLVCFLHLGELCSVLGADKKVLKSTGFLNLVRG